MQPKNSQKTQGQYMTPGWVVGMVLDGVGYKGGAVLGKKIMEPSFGDGAFLEKIAERVISAASAAGMGPDAIRQELIDDVFGIEKDESLYKAAINRLNLVLSNHGIPQPDWNKNLLCGDTLDEYEKFKDEMDFVVGNPPYVRIHNLGAESRAAIKALKFSGGMADLYVAFYEIGLLMLNQSGRLGFISPNSFMKNDSQKAFREYLVRNQWLSGIYDFNSSRVFDGISTYACICLLGKANGSHPANAVDYRVYDLQKETLRSQIPADAMLSCFGSGQAWNFSDLDGMAFMRENQALPQKLKDIAAVQNGITTMRDKIYIFKAYNDGVLSSPYMGRHTDAPKTVYFRGPDGAIRPIESGILRRCVKASKYNGEMDNTYILFPYSSDSCSPLSEDALKAKFPLAYAYLLSCKAELMRRDIEPGTDWFLFGRSQGLKNIGQKKIVMKDTFKKNTPNIMPYILDEDVVVYSKLYITAKPSNSLECIQDIIASGDFARYCSLIGRDKSGGYISITARGIRQFGIKT